MELNESNSFTSLHYSHIFLLFICHYYKIVITPSILNFRDKPGSFFQERGGGGIVPRDIHNAGVSIRKSIEYFIVTNSRCDFV